MFELMDAYSQNPVIKVIGVGGGGGNAVSHMATCGIEGVDFMCLNTDAQALKHSQVKTLLQIGGEITKGLGAGANPDVGRAAAQEDRERIVELIEGCDMLFITAGMGGGTGTGAAPIVAQVAKELGILTVAVVTRPFSMEGSKRSRAAEAGIAELSKYVDSLITIPNQKLLTVLGSSTTLLDAFKAANQVLQGAVQGIAELITRPGLVNVDFADVRTVMAETGMAMMGSGMGRGEGRARAAAEAAVSSPLLENIDLAGAHGILVNITAGQDMTIGEFEEVGAIVQQFASDDATVVVGTAIDPATILSLLGDASRGRRLYHEAASLQCRNCHMIGDAGREVGPPLTAIGGKLDRAKLLESMLEPSKTIDPKYQSWVVETVDGRVLTGLVVSKTDQSVVLRDAENKTVELPTAEIEQMEPQKVSLMPEHLLRDLTAAEAADLLAYLESLRTP